MTAGTADATALLRARLRRRLAGTRPATDGPASLAGLPPGRTEQYRHLLPLAPAAAAVLIPIVDRPDGLTVLLTQRSRDLRHHAGQIAFPGGRVEPADEGPVAAALRESAEEIGLAAGCVEVLGFLDDHLVMTGYRVTPVVGLVGPGFALRIDPTEVAAVFEVPLAFVLDPANHRLRGRPLGDAVVEVYEMPYGEHHIWGATAGMLTSLARLVGAPGDEDSER
jgi:8-oxo-dGTP pyrophosphatase MutT (NUDIX family)